MWQLEVKKRGLIDLERHSGSLQSVVEERVF